MSDEESFVILGTSPNSSLDIESLTIAENTKEVFTAKRAIAESQLTGSSSSSNGSQLLSIIHNGEAQAVSVGPTSPNGTMEPHASSLIADCICTPSKILEPNFPEGTPPSSPMRQSAGSNHSAEGSLATSFILGEVNSDVLKSSVYSQFPSIRSPNGTSHEDVLKMQNMLSEYLELKKTLKNTNLTMMQFYDQSQKWKTDVKAMEDERREEIAKLRNENLELRRDLEAKVEQININEELRRKENEELSRCLSEKSAQIENMNAQIQKLEQQQLASFEYIPKNPNEAPQPTNTVEYVTILEHQRIVKDFERKIDAFFAENLELKDMQAQYIDEINCLKVNQVSANELLNKVEDDIRFLKASDTEKYEMFTKLEDNNKALKIEIDVLRQQVDIYMRDFKIEQEARENLANEKDQLISDLRDLQRKNQELIQEAQKNYEEHSRQVMTATGAFPKTRAPAQPVPSPRAPGGNAIYTPTNFNCPICGKTFKTLGVLQGHVNQCLDGERC